MKLLIVESPAKAKTIGKYLGPDVSMRASVVHVRDLPKSNKKAIDIEGGFIPHYEVTKGKELIIADIKKEAKKADEIYLATDPDREGEAIAWHIAQSVGLKDPKRIVFHEITKEAVEEAIEHPRHIDMKLKEAQEARRVLDRLVGYDLSGLIWKKVRYGLSAGRVQSPALRIIMEREREIRAFVREKYWKILGLFETTGGKRSNLKGAQGSTLGSHLTLFCSEEPRDEKLVQRILEEGKKGNWMVKEIKKSEQKRVPRAPFTTSTLQQTASSRLGYSPSRTMHIAQKLYEAGHITYMRTDSTNLSSVAKTQIVSLIQGKYGKEYSQPRIYKTKSKNAQEAHEAIRPTHIENFGVGTEEQQKLYRLIWERTVSSQMADAKLLKIKISANITESPSESEFPDFSTTGSRILFAGWLQVDKSSAGENIELPEVKIREKLKLLNLIEEEKFTEPPNRYTEAGLIKELEARDIGRPSTYASIMKTLEDREYVKKEGKTLFPTDVGEVVSDFLEKHFANYISDTFTA